MILAFTARRGPPRRSGGSQIESNTYFAARLIFKMHFAKYFYDNVLWSSLLQLRPGCIKIHPHFTMWLIATPGPDSTPWNLQPFHFFTYLAF